MARVAVCEDDAAVRSVLRRALERDEHTVMTSTSAAGLLEQLPLTPELVLLDIGLPDADGRDVCAALRARGCDAPILMLTALDGVHNKISGFEAGADDYLTKPFDVAELLVRVRALPRRATAKTGADGLQLDPATHSVSCGANRQLLTPTEFRILARLMVGRDEVVRRHALVAAGWPHGARVSDNTLDSYVRRVRSKLEDLGAGRRISTVRGVGYRWD